MIPVVASCTTFGDAMSVGLSYRTTGFTTDKIDAILGWMIEQIETV